MRIHTGPPNILTVCSIHRRIRRVVIVISIAKPTWQSIHWRMWPLSIQPKRYFIFCPVRLINFWWPINWTFNTVVRYSEYDSIFYSINQNRRKLKAKIGNVNRFQKKKGKLQETVTNAAISVNSQPLIPIAVGT